LNNAQPTAILATKSSYDFFATSFHQKFFQKFFEKGAKSVDKIAGGGKMFPIIFFTKMSKK